MCCKYNVKIGILPNSQYSIHIYVKVSVSNYRIYQSYVTSVRVKIIFKRKKWYIVKAEYGYIKTFLIIWLNHKYMHRSEGDYIIL